MKAVVYDRNGLENIRVVELDKPRPGPHEVLVRVVEAGVNPIDYYEVVSIPVKPIPHIPGTEFAGIVEEVGDGVTLVKPGDRVVVYPRIFDGTCDLCLASMEHLCRNGGIIGVVTNGGWAEYVTLPERNLVKFSGDNWDIAASLPVAALTAYHALKRAGLRAGETLVVFGASGNTGQFAVQLGKIMGARVVAVTGKAWVKELGADYVVSANEARDLVARVTDGKMADVVIDPLGQATWSISLRLVGRGGRWVTFGQLTGGDVSLNISQIYSGEISLVGSTGGTRRELMELVGIMDRLKVRVDKVFSINEAKEALVRLFSRERNGRVMLRFT